MKVIDLLNKIANQEYPKEIRYGNYIYYRHHEGYFRSVVGSNWIGLFTDIEDIEECLNDEVEIIEEDKKIEKLDYIHPDISCSYNESELLLRIEANKDKINEIIDKINEEK